jgi:hypothetical protein
MDYAEPIWAKIKFSQPLLYIVNAKFNHNLLNSYGDETLKHIQS